MIALPTARNHGARSRHHGKASITIGCLALAGVAAGILPAFKTDPRGGIGPANVAAAEAPRSPDPDSLHTLLADAEKGKPGAQYELGVRYLRGNGVPASDSIAALWFRRAAEQGHAGAQFWMGAFYYSEWESTGDPTPRDECLRWLRASAEQANPPAEFCLGSMYRSGDGVPRDSAQAVTWLTSAAGHHSHQAESMLAVMYRAGEWQPASREEATKWFLEAAEEGDPAAQFSVALLLSESRTISRGLYALGSDAHGSRDLVGAYAWMRIVAEVDDEAGPLMQLLEKNMTKEDQATARRRAQDWLEGHPDYPPRREEAETAEGHALDIKDIKRRAEAGEAQAELQLAVAFHDGTGVARDYREAARWASLAANQGLAAAQLMLGYFYSSGEGVAQSAAKAVAWYQKAADGGSPQGQELLARLYSEGDGVPQDDRQALDWALKSAKQGWARGQYLAGFLLCCKIPSSVPSDNVSAYAWLTLAAKSGIEEAREALSGLEAGMKPAELDEARRRADSWRKTEPH